MKKLICHPSILEIDPYVQGLSEIQGVDKVIKLSSNESPFGASPNAIKAIKNHTDKVHRYADGNCNKLRQAIGEVYHLNPKHIVCGAGSDELIGLLCQAYAGPEDEVIYSEHGFLMYPISAKRVGAKPVIASEKEYKTDIDAVLSKVTEKTRIVFIANPNNPTGSYISDKEMRKLHKGLPGNVLLVIDAAYSEYVTAPDFDPGEKLASEADNVAVLHTFSKIYGLASLRLGWAYGSENIIDVLNRVRGPFNVSGIAQVAGIEAVKDVEFINKAREHNTRWITKWSMDISALGYKTLPSVGNYLLVEFPDEPGKNAEAIYKYLRTRGIIVRAMNSYKLPHTLRFSVGLDQDNEALLKALKEFSSQ